MPAVGMVVRTWPAEESAACQCWCQYARSSACIFWGTAKNSSEHSVVAAMSAEQPCAACIAAEQTVGSNELESSALSPTEMPPPQAGDKVVKMSLAHEDEHCI